MSVRAAWRELFYILQGIKWSFNKLRGNVFFFLLFVFRYMNKTKQKKVVLVLSFWTLYTPENMIPNKTQK